MHNSLIIARTTVGVRCAYHQGSRSALAAATHKRGTTSSWTWQVSRAAEFVTDGPGDSSRKFGWTAGPKDSQPPQCAIEAELPASQITKQSSPVRHDGAWARSDYLDGALSRQSMQGVSSAPGSLEVLGLQRRTSLELSGEAKSCKSKSERS